MEEGREHGVGVLGHEDRGVGGNMRERTLGHWGKGRRLWSADGEDGRGGR